MSDTVVPVRFEVLGVEPMRGCGSLLAVATVAVAIYDVEFILCGCQVRQRQDGRREAVPPQWRYQGKWVPCIGANEALVKALGAEINAAYEEMMACG